MEGDLKEDLQKRLLDAIQKAKEDVYQLFSSTPIDTHAWQGHEVFLKREDFSPIHSYKWRGAANKVFRTPQAKLLEGVVAASAGNHAQGLAACSQKLNFPLYLFMPKTAPEVKVRAVRRWAGENLNLCLVDGSYDDAAYEAQKFSQATNKVLIHPYDDLDVMAGQATLACEVVDQLEQSKVDQVFLQIGGGGLAGACACYLKHKWPHVKIFGVEEVGQASMHRAFVNREPTSLYNIDRFCDGTAVKKAGDLCYPLCKKYLDELVLVSKEEVCQAMNWLWEQKRTLAEPSGALGLAGWLKNLDACKKSNRSLVVLTGANFDFSMLAQVAQVLNNKKERVFPKKLTLVGM